MSEEILIFGAGNIGRSFVGQIFGRAGFTPVFVEVDKTVISALQQRKSYEVVQYHADGGEDVLTIGPVGVVDGGDSTAVAAALSRVRYAATAVGAAVFPKIVPLLAAEAQRPERQDGTMPPLDVILAENIHNARDILLAAAPAAGVIPCSVGKMVPIVTAAQREQDILRVYSEAYNTLIVDREGWRNPIPPVPELYPVHPITPWIDRKLYIHNMGHGVAAYLAGVPERQHVTMHQALQDEEIRHATVEAMQLSAGALAEHYPGVFTLPQLHEHIDDLVTRFASKALGDTVFRVGRDISRKLAPGDRIMGPLRRVMEHRGDPTPLVRVYQAALRFAATDEHGAPFPGDALLQRRLQTASPEERWAILAELSGFDPDDREDHEILATISAAIPASIGQ